MTESFTQSRIQNKKVSWNQMGNSFWVRLYNRRHCIIKPYKQCDVCGYRLKISWTSAQQTEGETIVKLSSRHTRSVMIKHCTNVSYCFVMLVNIFLYSWVFSRFIDAVQVPVHILYAWMCTLKHAGLSMHT